MPDSCRASGVREASVRGRVCLSKIGNARLRKALYFPAITALRSSDFFKAWAEPLRTRGKSKMSVIGAAMRKLIHLAYGVLKTGKPFDPNWAKTRIAWLLNTVSDVGRNRHTQRQSLTDNVIRKSLFRPHVHWFVRRVPTKEKQMNIKDLPRETQLDVKQRLENYVAGLNNLPPKIYIPDHNADWGCGSNCIAGNTQANEKRVFELRKN